MSRARDLSKLVNPSLFSVSADNNVGVNSTAPVEKLNVVGVVSATSFYGDGSKLEGVSSAGLGTAVVDDSPYGGEQIYYTNKALNITGNLTVDVPDSAEVAYTQYQEIVVDSGADFIVGDGDDFIPDILGIGSDVQQPGLLAGGGGRVRADNFSDKSGTGAPTFSSGVVVTGVATATTFSGNVTGNATGLSGTPDITVGDITANNISIGGTLTYEDVTNIDSIGIVTARNGVHFGLAGVGGSVSSAGNANFAGIVTATTINSTESRFKTVAEEVKVGTGVSVTIDYLLGDGNIGIITAPTGPISLYVNNIPTTNFSNKLLSYTVTVIQGATGYACSSVYFNGIEKTLSWPSGFVSAGNTSSIDYYNFVGIDTGSNGNISDYIITANLNGNYTLY